MQPAIDIMINRDHRDLPRKVLVRAKLEKPWPEKCVNQVFNAWKLFLMMMKSFSFWIEKKVKIILRFYGFYAD